MGDFDDEKRKRKDEDSEEDLSFSDVDEDEEDEESEERHAPRKKKRKTEGRSDLVLLEAEEDDDDEDEDEIDGDDLFEGAGEDIGGGSDTEENRHKARELFKTLSKDVDENDLKAMADRYKQSSRMVEDFDEFPVDANDALAIRQSLLPTTADPAMWCVRCQEGKERDVVRDLLAKFLISLEGPAEDRLHIFSAHCVDGDKGRFYVESRKESHVRTALAQIPFVRLTTPFKLLKRMEMPRVLVVPEKAQLQEGQWVRIKNGIYRDDLAQVWALSETSNDRVVVRIVPRISKEQYNGETGPGKRGRAESRAMRPAARPFRPEEVSDKSSVELLGERTKVTNVGEKEGEEDDGADGGGEGDEVRWNGMNFKTGLLVKEFRLSGLHTANIHPTQEEVGRFKRAVASWQKSQGTLGGSGVGGDPSSQSGAVSNNPLDNFSVEGSSLSLSPSKPGGSAKSGTSSSSSAVVFSKGDHIQVTRGEYVSVTGIVTFATSANVEFRPDDVSTFGKKIITVPSIQVRKYFGPGLHVKILSGVYSGETGTITAVHDDTVTIYSDVVHKEIKANMADLQIAFSTGSGNTSLGSYHLFDLVQLGDSVGVIVDVERDGFQILGENGQTRYVPLAEVGARRNVAKASIGDAHNNYVNLGETVRILEGPYKDLTGILKHISRSTVFIQCQNALVRDNRGLVCLRKHHIASVIDRSSPASNNAGGNRVIHGMGGAAGGGSGGSGGGGGGGGGGPAAGARRIDPGLMRKEVIVKKGQWKGYRGMIKSASEREYTVLLSTGSRTVKVPKEDVAAADAVQGASGGTAGHHGGRGDHHNNHHNNDYNGSQTPMRHMTPRHPSSGGGSGGAGSYDAWVSGGSGDSRRASSQAMDEFDPNYRPSASQSASSTTNAGGNAMDVSSGIMSAGHHIGGMSSSSTPGSTTSSATIATNGQSSFLTPQIPQTPGFGLQAGGNTSSDAYARLSSVTTPGGVPFTPYGSGSMMPPMTPGVGLGIVPPMTPGGAMMAPPMTPGAPLLSSAASSSSYGLPQTPGGASLPSSISSGGAFAYPATPGGALVPSTPGGIMMPSTPASSAGLSSVTSSSTSSLSALLPGGISAASLSSLSALSSLPPYTPGGLAMPSTPGGPLLGSSGSGTSSFPPIPMTPGAPSSSAMDISLGSSSAQPASSAAAPASSAAASLADPDSWCQVGFEVFDATSSETPAPRFVILDPMRGTPLVKVEALRADGERTGIVSNITKSSLRLVPPSKKDRVAIITTGKIGILIGIDEQDGGVSGGHGIVKNPDDSEIQVLPMSSFAKVHTL